MLKRFLFSIACAVMLVASAGQAQAVTFYDIDANPGAWAAAIAGYTTSTIYDFDADPDYGLAVIDSPLTSAGGGPVSPGNLAAGVTMSASLGNPNMVGLGPSAGFGNPLNGIAPNFFADSLTMDFSVPVHMIQFNTFSLLGTGTADLMVTESINGVTSFLGVNVGTGRNIGLIAMPGNSITSINISGPDTSGEGVQGLGLIGSPGSVTAAVPEPATAALALLGLGGLLIGRRRIA